MGNRTGNSRPSGVAAAIMMPTTSFAQKRADRQADLAYTQQLFQIEQQNLAQKQNEQKKITDAFNYVNTLDLLTPDKQRLQAFSDTLEQKIADKIKNKYGGNLRKYMMEEGEADLYEYKTNLVSSDYLKIALTNKTNKGQYDIADVDGKIHRKVKWTDAKGNVKTGTFEEAYMDYANMQTQSLPYNGAYSGPQKTHEYFSKTFSPRGHYVGDEPTETEVYAALVGEGMTPEDAADYMSRYYQDGMYRYKMGDVDALNLKKFDMQLKLAQFNETQNMNRERMLQGRERLKMGWERTRIAQEAAAGGSGENEMGYWWKDVGPLYDAKGKLVAGKDIKLGAKDWNIAMGADSGSALRPLVTENVYVGEPSTSSPSIKSLGRPAYGTGKVKTVQEGSEVVMYEQVVVTMSKQDAVREGLVSKSGFKPNAKYGDGVRVDSDWVRVTGWSKVDDLPSSVATRYAKGIANKYIGSQGAQQAPAFDDSDLNEDDFGLTKYSE